jgi:hypothetical protein
MTMVVVIMLVVAVCFMAYPATVAHGNVTLHLNGGNSVHELLRIAPVHSLLVLTGW